MIRIGILDDNPNDLNAMEQWLQTQADVHIEWRCHTALEAYQLLKHSTIDLLIADIEMEGLTGYELAERLRAQGISVDIIFVTGHSGFAVHAFDLDVVDYVMKPISPSRMEKALQRFRSLNAQTDGPKLTIQQQGDMIVVSENDILYIERTGRSSTIHTATEEISTYQSLQEIEQELQSTQFFRTHRSFITNLKKITQFAPYTKHSLEIRFQGSDKRALVTKKNLKTIQDQFPILS
ncbi:LytTR family DNA-binding domain-containing protein [Geomicrobium sp. JCM 19038]|uniref:LytR/AlgR family response regulator transcription factor n=1 Tax=Geomicrobium sp. JCM 19038 TaxID=1460635 RepID=UPI00045F43C3|nr:LytTR family DNA-binding domain-containing protein [Geomicrobium sp. JCM 19038]GAK07851.1 two-component system response regulator [Geomicrobium sp. JCM 19038]